MLDGDHYAGIVTVLAVAIGAVYASGGYDVWDMAIGFLALFMAFSYAKDERMKVLSFRAMVTALASCGSAVILICGARLGLHFLTGDSEASLARSFWYGIDMEFVATIFFFLLFVVTRSRFWTGDMRVAAGS